MEIQREQSNENNNEQEATDQSTLEDAQQTSQERHAEQQHQQSEEDVQHQQQPLEQMMDSEDQKKYISNTSVDVNTSVNLQCDVITIYNELAINNL